jgi:hypothetical protein
MEREKAWSQQLLQLDVVCGYEYLRVRTEPESDQSDGASKRA